MTLKWKQCLNSVIMHIATTSLDEIVAIRNQRIVNISFSHACIIFVELNDTGQPIKVCLMMGKLGDGWLGWEVMTWWVRDVCDITACTSIYLNLITHPMYAPIGHCESHLHQAQHARQPIQCGTRHCVLRGHLDDRQGGAHGKAAVSTATLTFPHGRHTLLPKNGSRSQWTLLHTTESCRTDTGDCMCMQSNCIVSQQQG